MNRSNLKWGVKRLAALATLIGSTNCYDCDPTWEIEMNLLSKQLIRQHNLSEEKLAYMVKDVLEGKNPFTARWQRTTPIISK